MATLCKRCLQPIQWKQDSAERWVAMELNGKKEHLFICRGEPLKGSKQDLKIQLANLEQELKKAKGALAGAQFETRHWQAQYRELADKQHIFTFVQNILNTGVAWFRAREARNGKTDEKLDALKDAVIRYCEIEGKGKKKAS